MFINQKAVKAHIHAAGKQLERESLESVNQAVRLLLDRAIKNAGHFRRIRPLEVLHGLNGKG